MNPFDRAHGRSVECTREQEVLDALAAGGGVGDWSAELRTHAGACAICRDIVTVALPLLQEHHAAVDGAHPPSSGIVWWRATMRARQEAAQAATRPITVVQGVALASAAALFVMVLSAAAPMLSGWFGSLSTFGGIGESFTLPQVDLSSLMPTTGTGLLLVGACVVCLLLGPLAVYFATGDE